jgi:hypothetical protein
MSAHFRLARTLRSSGSVGLLTTDRPREVSRDGVLARSRGARSAAALWAIGAAMVAVFYLGLTRRYPLAEHVNVLQGWGDLTKFDRVAGYTYLATMLLLAALFALAALVVRHVPYTVARWPIWLGALAAGAVVLPMYPGGSVDVFVYAGFTRVWVHFAANPLVVPAATYPQDPIARLAAGWAGIPSPYGPFWVILSAFPELLARADVLTTVLLYKAMALGFHLASIALVSWILGKVSPGWRSLGTLLIAWNPAILFETVGNGHNDGAMMVLVLAAIALSLSRSEHWRLAAPSVLALAALVKYTSVLLLPVILLYHAGRLPDWRARLRYLVISGLLAGVVVAALFAPFWEGPRTLDAARFQNTLTVSTPVWILNYLVKQHLPALKVLDLPQKVLFAAFGLFYLAQLIRLARRPGLWLAVAFEVVFFSLYAVGKFYPWYAVWPLALGALVPSRRRLAWLLPFTTSVLVWNFFMDFAGHWMADADPTTSLLRANVCVVALVFVVPGLVRLYLWLRSRRAVGARWGPRFEAAEGEEALERVA